MSKSTGPNRKSSEWSKLEQREQQGTVQFSSVAQSCLTLCDPMDHSTPGFPVHHQLPELTQTHVHWVGDAIQALNCSYNYTQLCICIYVCVLSCFSRVWLFATLWTIAVQAPLLCSKESPGKNPGVGCCTVLQWNFPNPGSTCVFYVAGISRRIPYH